MKNTISIRGEFTSFAEVNKIITSRTVYATTTAGYCCKVRKGDLRQMMKSMQKYGHSINGTWSLCEGGAVVQITFNPAL